MDHDVRPEKGLGKNKAHSEGIDRGGNAVPAPVGHNPPGNNGTVKIHSVAGDAGHHNVAHVGCSFVVDFWNFDQGQTLDVSFTGQAPTGRGVPVTLAAPDGTSLTSPHPAGGGNDFDGQLPFLATPDALAVLGAPAKQGYHLRLLVATHQGGGMKQKVFWITPCAAPASATSSHAPVTPTATPALPTLLPSHAVPTTAPHAGIGSVYQDTTARGDTPALQAAWHPVADSPPISSLPFTGADIAAMTVGGLAAIGAGLLLIASARRRRKSG